MWVITVLILFGRAYSKRYHVGPQPLTWFQAEKYCVANLNSNLASIGSASENQEAKSECLTSTNNADNGCWIALRDIANELGWIGSRAFRNADNSIPAYMNWSPGEPNDNGAYIGAGEDCVMLYGGDGKWNDASCFAQLYPLCNDPRPAEYESVGCYKDTGDRALNDKTPGRSYTPDTCATACDGYQYFAIQDGDECFCEQTYDDAIKHGPAPADQCKHGNGASWVNSLYKSLLYHGNCEDGNDNCDENASCINTEAGFTCKCNDGYAGDGVACQVCFDRGPCNDGYMDRTNGQWKHWGCGSGCAGGSYTDGTCNCVCVEAGSCSEIPGYDNFNLYRYVPQLAFIRAIGIWGEYLSILLILINTCILAVFCCKGKLKRKWGKIKKPSKYEGASIVDNEMEDEIEKEPLNEYL